MEKSETFVAIDFETANRWRDSACAVGLIRVECEKIVYQKSFLIRPPKRFFEFTFIHGITWSMVYNKPGFGELWDIIEPVIRGVDFLAAHNASFDRSVLNECCVLAGLEVPNIPFRDTVSLARKVLGVKPANLPNVCRYLGIDLKHHDPLSDARACAQIVLAAQEEMRNHTQRRTIAV